MEALKLRSHLEARLTRLCEHAKKAMKATYPEEPEPRLAFAMSELAVPLARTIVRYVTGLVDGKNTQRAVLERQRLADRWDLRQVAYHEEERGTGIGLALRELAHAELALGTFPPPYWPPDVAPLDIAEALRRTRDKEALPLVRALEGGAFFPRDGKVGARPDIYSREHPPIETVGGEQIPGGPALEAELARALDKWSIPSCALIVSLEKEVRAALHRPMIALDAGRPHHEILSGIVHCASRREPFTMIDKRSEPGRCEIVLPGAKVLQLSLPYDRATLPEAFANAIREWRSFGGLRHWAALQRLLSIEGGRSGRIRWKLDEHLDALGYSDSWRQVPANREDAAKEVAVLVQIELAIYKPDGTLRMRGPILAPTMNVEVPRSDGPGWTIEGMELRVHPLLYDGVRDSSTGKLGSHWYPAPAELAKIDHIRFPYAIALGLVLPLRWRWIWAEEGKDHLTIEAAKLLNVAGIKLETGRAWRAWEKLDRNLEELERIGELGRVEWVGPKHQRTTMVRLYPADWLLDRTVRGLVPIERKRIEAPQTGAELVEFRKAKGWSQVALAKELDVNEKTIRRAEAAPEKALSRSIADALKALQEKRPATGSDGPGH